MTTETIGIFTACYNYEKYLPEWESYINKLNPLADEVIIIGDEKAKDIWSGSHDFIFAPEYGNPFKQVASYNHIVGEMTSDWIMHIGVDDRVHSNLVKDLQRVQEREPEADVIAFDSNLFQGPVFVSRRFNNPTNKLILRETRGRQPLDACALFRRSLWEKSHYSQEMEGASDVALWIDFAKLGAHFTSTRNVGIDYVLHDDSLWHKKSATRVQELRAMLNKRRRTKVSA